MNPILSPNSSFLPLNQLSPHCTRLLESLDDGRTSQKERLLLEQTLWNEVKRIRTLKDTTVYMYLIGYYHTILYQIADSQSTDDLFQYHVLIRLGDLERYVDRVDVSEYHYCNARNLFPYFGHAYNQLGLLTKPTNCFKCCYYYARAARSTYRPLNKIADSNLRIAVNKYNCEMLNHILNEQTIINLDEIDTLKLPKTALEWFYVIVVAIYADNIQSIARAFLDYLSENFSTQKATTYGEDTKTTTISCDHASYVLLSGLDILLDWLKLSSHFKAPQSSIVQELAQIRASLKNIASFVNNDWRVNSISVDSLSGSPLHVDSNSSVWREVPIITDPSTSTSSTLQKKSPALPHDYILRGFSPLDPVHSHLKFSSHTEFNKLFEDDLVDEGKKFIQGEHLYQVMLRIKSKIDTLGIISKRRTRNIALESILSNAI